MGDRPGDRLSSIGTKSFAPDPNDNPKFAIPRSEHNFPEVCTSWPLPEEHGRSDIWHTEYVQRDGLQHELGVDQRTGHVDDSTRCSRSELSAQKEDPMGKNGHPSPEKEKRNCTTNRIKLILFITLPILMLLVVTGTMTGIAWSQNKQLHTKIRYLENSTRVTDVVRYMGTPVFNLPHPTDIPLVAGFCPPLTEGDGKRKFPIVSAGNGEAFFECYNNTYFASGDLMGFTALSLQICLDACWNWNRLRNQTQCRAVTMNPDLGKVYKTNHESSCWLKENVTRDGMSDLATSAMLCLKGGC